MLRASTLVMLPQTFRSTALFAWFFLSICVLWTMQISAQEDKGFKDFRSPKIGEQGEVSFYLYAPQAEFVRLGSFDLPQNSPGTPMQRDGNGFWSITLRDVPAGAYRYVYLVDSMPVIDPRNPEHSESFNSLSSMFYMPGSSLLDLQDVSHGSVSSSHYMSKIHGCERRFHIYLPPGYAKSPSAVPVMYLLHGGGDSDNTWASVGCIDRIMDNLIAAERCPPMLVVMPCSYTPPKSHASESEEVFYDELINELIPYVDQTYRTIAQADGRAVIGNARGGRQALVLGLMNPDYFSNIGAFSTGWPREQTFALEKLLANNLAKTQLKKIYIGTATEDFRREATLEVYKDLNQEGFHTELHEFPGLHRWNIWRDHLIELTPLLFADDQNAK